jgi:dihydrofolate reductase
MSMIEFVVAVSRGGVIGRDGGLPWHIPSELKRFKQITMGKPVIMGRRTWESLPRKPLPGRLNIVITRQRGYRADGAIIAGSKTEALAAAGTADEIAIIGGGEIYALFMPDVRRIYLTEVELSADGDTRLPPLDPAVWTETAREEVAADAVLQVPGYVLRTLLRRGTD